MGLGKSFKKAWKKTLGWTDDSWMTDYVLPIAATVAAAYTGGATLGAWGASGTAAASGSAAAGASATAAASAGATAAGTAAAAGAGTTAASVAAGAGAAAAGGAFSGTGALIGAQIGAGLYQSGRASHLQQKESIRMLAQQREIANRQAAAAAVPVATSVAKQQAVDATTAEGNYATERRRALSMADTSTSSRLQRWASNGKRKTL